jgi:hypothetical protein
VLLLGALLLRDHGALLLRHLLDGGGAVGDVSCGALLVGDSFGDNAALGDRGGCALLLSLRSRRKKMFGTATKRSITQRLCHLT